MEYVLIVNGKKEIVDESSAIRALYEKIRNSHALDDDNPLLIYWLGENISCRDNIKEVVTALKNNDPTFDPVITPLFSEKNDELSFPLQNIALARFVNNSFSLYLKHGPRYIHTNFFNGNEDKILFFKARYHYHRGLGFFVSEDDPLKEISIVLMPKDIALEVENLTKECLTDSFKVAIRKHHSLWDERKNLGYILPINIAYQIALYFADDSNIVSRDYESALLMLLNCYDKKVSYPDKVYMPDYLVDCYYHMAHCYLKTNQPSAALYYLKVGAGSGGFNNICALEIAELASSNRFSQTFYEELSWEEIVSYYKKAGEIGREKLGDYYLSISFTEMTPIEEAMKCYEKESTYNPRLGLCYALKHDFTNAVPLFNVTNNNNFTGLDLFANNLGIALCYGQTIEINEHHLMLALIALERFIKRGIPSRWKKSASPVVIDLIRGLQNADNDYIEYLYALCFVKGVGVRRDPVHALNHLSAMFNDETDSLEYLFLLRDLLEDGQIDEVVDRDPALLERVCHRIDALAEMEEADN